MSTMSTASSCYDHASTHVSEDTEELWDPIWGFVFHQDSNDEETLVSSLNDNLSTTSTAMEHQEKHNKKSRGEKEEEEQSYDNLLYGSNNRKPEKGLNKFNEMIRKRSWFRRKQSESTPTKEANAGKGRLEGRKLLCFSKQPPKKSDPQEEEEIPRVRSRSTRIFEDRQPDSGDEYDHHDNRKLICEVRFDDHSSEYSCNGSGGTPKRGRSLLRRLSSKKLQAKEEEKDNARASVKDSNNSAQCDGSVVTTDSGYQSEHRDSLDSGSVGDSSTYTKETKQEESALEVFFNVCCFYDEPIPNLNKRRGRSKRNGRIEQRAY
mmetsp:Transcript_23539/g.33019  ORF Transcript_23539/g.33019 Transcript_23539/m.33019 type:complete len:320 (+) Transcript_23539:142-1101(+)